MVILVVHQLGVFAYEPERDAPVAAHLDGPGSFARAFELVQIEPRQAQVSRSRGGIQEAQQQSKAVRVLRLNTLLAPGGKEALQALMPETLDRHESKCNAWGYGIQSG